MTSRAPHADRVYRAELLSPDAAADACRISRLKSDGNCDVFDTLPMQVADLLRSQQPGRDFTVRELTANVAGHIEAHGGDRYGFWAYYAWSRRLIRLLPEREFIALRTDRNRDKITVSEQALLARKRVGIIGLSVGQSIALTLALGRVAGGLKLADHDDVDLSNLNRLRCGLHQLGTPKTLVAAREIAEIDPYLDVECFHGGYGADCEDRFLDGLDLVIEECDSLDVKLQVREAARTRRIPVLMSTSDRGMTDIERFDLEPSRPIFHGRLHDLRAADLVGLETAAKVPHVLAILGSDDISARMRDSMSKVTRTLRTWPQLASDVALGGAIIAHLAQRIFLGEPVASGRYLLDLENLGKPDDGALSY